MKDRNTAHELPAHQVRSSRRVGREVILKCVSFPFSFSKSLVTQSLVLLRKFQELAWQINYKKLVFPSGKRQTSLLFFKCDWGVKLRLIDRSTERVVREAPPDLPGQDAKVIIHLPVILL